MGLLYPGLSAMEMGHCCLCSVGFECHAKVCGNWQIAEQYVWTTHVLAEGEVPPDPYPLDGGGRWSHSHGKGFTCMYSTYWGCDGVYMCLGRGETLCTFE